jgi:hypothetical protein
LIHAHFHKAAGSSLRLMVGVKMASNRSKGAGQLMMVQFLIALAAGCASALMFVSIISGALISLVLFYLAPLPLMVAALGWGPLTALIGGVTTCVVVGSIFGLPYMLAAAVTIAGPAWWLGHLALLAKPVENTATTAPSPLDWYPPGRLLLWIAAFASLTTISALLSLGLDISTVTEVLRRGLTRIFAAQDATGDSADTDKLVTLLVTIAPMAASLVTMVTLTLNLWLAGKITKTSGRLSRPWPALSTIELPQMTLVALSFAIALSFTEGLLALGSQVITATLVMGYAFMGFAVLHALTQATVMRGLWLGSTYAAVTIFGWPLIIVALVGIADSLFGFRQRKAQGIKPPTISP